MSPLHGPAVYSPAKCSGPLGRGEAVLVAGLGSRARRCCRRRAPTGRRPRWSARPPGARSRARGGAAGRAPASLRSAGDARAGPARRGSRRSSSGPAPRCRRRRSPSSTSSGRGRSSRRWWGRCGRAGGGASPRGRARRGRGPRASTRAAPARSSARGRPAAGARPPRRARRCRPRRSARGSCPVVVDGAHGGAQPHAFPEPPGHRVREALVAGGEPVAGVGLERGGVLEHVGAEPVALERRGDLDRGR